MTENERCSGLAEKAMLAIYSPEEIEEAGVRDLLADLMHYCHKHEIDFDYECEMAESNFAEEVKQIA